MIHSGQLRLVTSPVLVGLIRYVNDHARYNGCESSASAVVVWLP